MCLLWLVFIFKKWESFTDGTTFLVSDMYVKYTLGRFFFIISVIDLEGHVVNLVVPGGLSCEFFPCRFGVEVNFCYGYVSFYFAMLF